MPMVFQRISPYDQQGRLFCHTHNAPAILRTSHTVGNRDREFYTCPLRARDGPENCGFFYWKDQLPPPPEIEAARLNTPPPTTSYPAMGTPANRLKSSTSPFLPSPTSPTKRGSMFRNDEETKRKRIKTMKDAISPSHHSGNTGNQAKATISARALKISGPVSEVLRTPESPARISPNKDQVMASPSGTAFPKFYKLSDLGLDLDQNHSAVKHDEDDELWESFSPSSSAEHVADSLLRFNDDSKGKRRVVDSGPVDDDVKFWQGAPAVGTSKGSLFHRASPSPNESSTVASPIMETPALSGDHIEHIVTSAMNDLSGIPDYVYTLERKLAAMEKSNAFKANRIKELEAENQKLKSPQGGWSSRR